MSGDFLSDLGIKVPDILAGLAGGAVRTLFDSTFKPVVTVLSAIAGGLTANYLGGTFSAGVNHLLEPWIGGPVDHGASSFIIGAASMWLVQGIVGRAKKWAGGENGKNGNGK